MHEPDRALGVDGSSSWEGQLRVLFDRKAERTRLARSYQQAPLKIQRPYYPEGPRICHAVTIHNAGGIIGGDRLAIDVEVGSGAHVAMTSASAGKVHGGRGDEARQLTRLKLGPGAGLEWLPRESIAFEGSCFRQDVIIDLSPGAFFFGWDIVRFGRTARGERFLSGEWRSTTEVWQHGKPLWIDRQELRGSGEWRSLQGLAGEPVIGSLALLGSPVLPPVAEEARALWFPEGKGEIGVTRLPAGLLCRYRGPSSAEALRWFLRIWRLLRLRSAERNLRLPIAWSLNEDLLG